MSDFPGLRPGLSSQAPLGLRSENLRTIATTFLPKSSETSNVFATETSSPMRVGQVTLHLPAIDSSCLVNSDASAPRSSFHVWIALLICSD